MNAIDQSKWSTLKLSQRIEDFKVNTSIYNILNKRMIGLIGVWSIRIICTSICMYLVCN